MFENASGDNVVYAMISGTGTDTANLKVNHSYGQFLPLMTTPDGRLMVDTELVLSGSTFILNNVKVGTTNQVEGNMYLQTSKAGTIVTQNDFMISNVSGTVTIGYYGFSSQTPNWYVMKENINTNTYTYATNIINAGVSYATAWSAGPATLTYAPWNSAW